MGDRLQELRVHDTNPYEERILTIDSVFVFDLPFNMKYVVT